MLKKIKQCCYVFDFNDPMADLRAKEIKRAALNEILDYITNYKEVLSEPLYPEIVKMVHQNWCMRNTKSIIPVLNNK